MKLSHSEFMQLYYVIRLTSWKYIGSHCIDTKVLRRQDWVSFLELLLLIARLGLYYITCSIIGATKAVWDERYLQKSQSKPTLSRKYDEISIRTALFHGNWHDEILPL